MADNLKKAFRYRSWSLALKLTVIFSALITAVVVSVGVSSYMSYKKTIRDEIQRFVPQTLVQVNRHLDTYISEMISISQEILKAPYYDLFHEFESAWKQGGNQPTIENSLLLNQAIQFVSRGYDRHLLGLIYYSNDGYAYIRTNTGGGSWLQRDYHQEDWYEPSRKLSLSILGTRKEILFDNELRMERAPYAFTIVQPIPNPEKNGISGILQISGDLESVSSILVGMDMGTNSNIYITDNGGKIVYSSDNRLLGKVWEADDGIDLKAAHSDMGSQVIDLHGSRMLASYSKSSKTGWTVISMIPLKVLTSGISSVGTWTVAMVLLAVVVSALAARMIAYGVTNPIRHLSKQLDKLDEDNFRIIHKPERSDEIGVLWKAYEGMVMRIRVLVEEVLKSKLLKQESEIKALRSQINPHFINNALENIRMTLVRERYGQVESALVSLGDIMRYQCLHMEETVPAKKEIEMVRSVLHIQKIRFGDRLSVDYDIDAEVDDMLIPSFMIQPLVENAVKYGVSPGDGCIRIVIRIKAESGYITGSVIDEGEGLDDGQLDHVIQLMEYPDKGGPQIGLSNISQRLRLIYNGRAEFAIDSAKGAGTIVKFRLPVIPNEAGAEEL